MLVTADGDTIGTEWKEGERLADVDFADDMRSWNPLGKVYD